MTTWRDLLKDQTDSELEQEIDVFETQMELRKRGSLDEKIFAETRLRRGIYGQRYDNGQRHDGLRVQELDFACGDLKKGPDTLWDAPGMVRIKIPFGGLTPDQLDLLADLSEEYSDAVLHVTTRQDFQLHYVHIDDTPDLMRRLAAVGITTREACGNTVRNITACPLSGVCKGEVFDVTPYARACTDFLLGHPDTQDFGRKFKIAFSGCSQDACGLVKLHDMGAIAAIRRKGGAEKRGFELYIGGGLGAVPHQAQLFDAFLPEEDLLPTAQAISRVFARLGEKKIRARARIKFLVAKLGIEKFREMVLEERERMPLDTRWRQYLKDVDAHSEVPLHGPVVLQQDQPSSTFKLWSTTNVYRQRQPGYVVITVTLPLGDISAAQTRALADAARLYAGENIRLTVEQNVVLRWVSEGNLPQLHEALERANLSEPGAGTISDITACPGTDTCKLGISSSRGLASEIRRHLANSSNGADQSAKDLRIKISGCFNSCGQHHVADLGFYGISRTRENRKVPHFQVVLGGSWKENAGKYGLAIGAVPSKRIPDAVQRIREHYVNHRIEGEQFQEFAHRVGKVELRRMLEDLMVVPSYQEDPSFYTDWGDPREFTLGDMGVGECAGEVVAFGEFELAEAERLVFEAQLSLESGEFAKADQFAFKGMLEAVKGLLRSDLLDVPQDETTLIGEFRSRFHETELFHDKYAGSKFAEYLFRRAETPLQELTDDVTRRQIEEAQLFIEAAHACRDRIVESKSVAVAQSAEIQTSQVEAGT